MDCGPYASIPYDFHPFYQFGSSFSRDDGLNAIGQFCDEQIKKKRVVGKAGVHPKDNSKLTAVPLVVQTYEVPGGSGNIMIRMQADVDNKNGFTQCPGKFDIYDFTSSKSASEKLSKHILMSMVRLGELGICAMQAISGSSKHVNSTNGCDLS